MDMRLDEPAEPLRVTPLLPNDRRVDELLELPRPVALPRLMPGDGTARISPMPLLDEPPDEKERRIDGPLPLGEFDEPRLIDDDPRLIDDDPRLIDDDPRLIDGDPRLIDDDCPRLLGDEPRRIPDDCPTFERVPLLILDRVDGAMLDRERLMPGRLIPGRLVPWRLIPERPTFARDRDMPELDGPRLTPRDGDDDRDRLIPLDRDEDRLTPREPDEERDRLMPLDRPRDCASLVSVNAKTQTAAIIHTKLVRVAFMAGTSKVRPTENSSSMLIIYDKKADCKPDFRSIQIEPLAKIAGKSLSDIILWQGAASPISRIRSE